MDYARALLESPGLTLADISERTGWGQTTLSHFAIAWGIKRKQTRKRKALACGLEGRT